MPSVRKNIPHDSAIGHVSGESVYIDDVAPLRGELIVDFVWPIVVVAADSRAAIRAAKAAPQSRRW